MNIFYYGYCDQNIMVINIITLLFKCANFFFFKVLVRFNIIFSSFILKKNKKKKKHNSVSCW